MKEAESNAEMLQLYEEVCRNNPRIDAAVKAYALTKIINLQKESNEILQNMQDKLKEADNKIRSGQLNETKL